MDETEATAEPTAPDGQTDDAYRAPVALGSLLFAFGVAAGFLLAFSGYAVLEDSASTVVAVFLTAVFIVALFGTVVFLLRKPLLRRITGIADAQLERFATPLADVAEGAIAGDPTRATSAARDLVRLTLARYAWLTTRRWLIASLTGLIAAMAALAGTALLFKQNQLLARQSELLAEQNARLGTQIELLAQDIQLSEAARNAQLAVEITRIAELLGQAMLDATARTQGTDPAPGLAGQIPVLDPVLDIDHRLAMRIVSASRAVKPYRFLRPALNAFDDSDKLRVANLIRKAELPKSYADMSAFFGWDEQAHDAGLIARPASPERAQLLDVLTRSGLRDLEWLNGLGLDLSFAWAPDSRLLGVSAQGAQLSYARFDRAHVLGSDFGAGSLENSSFRGAWISDTRFRSLNGADARPPFQAEGEFLATGLAGADFRGAVLQDVDFSAAQAGAARFEAATLQRVSFSGASLGAADFAGAVLVDVVFDGAALQSVEFDGAFVFREDFLTHLAEVALPGTFRADRYKLEAATFDQVLEQRSAFISTDETDLRAQSGSDTVWRVVRTAPFETASTLPEH